MRKIGVFYGPEQGSVERVARLIVSILGEDRADLISVKGIDEKALDQYDKLIFGLSTVGKTNWDSAHQNTDWDYFFTRLKYADWEDKVSAIFGLGDQVQYPYHFVDAMGWLYDILQGLKVPVVGACDPESYQFKESEALRGGKFVGLPLDEDFESELTAARVRSWLNVLQTQHLF